MGDYSDGYANNSHQVDSDKPNYKVLMKCTNNECPYTGCQHHGYHSPGRHCRHSLDENCGGRCEKLCDNHEPDPITTFCKNCGITTSTLFRPRTNKPRKVSDTQYKNPSLTVDGIILIDGQIVLIERGNEPFNGQCALPGGFVEYGESVEDAVVREILEETGISTKIKKLVGVYSNPNRDPRGHVVSVVFELTRIDGIMKSGDDAVNVGLFNMDELPELAFDHKEIITDYTNQRGES